MNNMFYNCRLIKILDLTNFNTKEVENMESMFESCDNLIKLDISSFDTS